MALGHKFYVTEDTLCVAQFVGAFTAIVSAPKYTGRILVLIGEKDQAFCGPGCPVLSAAYCGDLLAETKELFPAADYSWKSIQHSGHAVILHRYRKSADLAAAQF